METGMKINELEFEAARKAVPAPKGTIWCHDPAATSDRLRLFFGSEHGGLTGPEICGAYPDGSWWVAAIESKEYQPMATGREDEGQGLHAAMRRALRVAKAVGWFETGDEHLDEAHHLAERVNEILRAGGFDEVEVNEFWEDSGLHSLIAQVQVLKGVFNTAGWVLTTGSALALSGLKEARDEYMKWSGDCDHAGRLGPICLACEREREESR